MKKSVHWIPHFHWDREWYRSFQSFRAYLVDSVDAVLDQLAAEPEFKFLLDGQSVVLEDYVEIRPQREPEIRRAVEQGRLGIGPWYVQPDSLLPSGEAHIRNLLIGRSVANAFGSCSNVAYTPDSFGHPAQFPQLFAGFNMRAFVYWRGNGNELDSLPSDYRWISPDGSNITACLLSHGYFNGAMLPANVTKAVDVLKIAYLEATEKSEQDAVLIMNGTDHMPPHSDATTMAHKLAAALDTDVDISLLEDYVDRLGDKLPEYEGALIGGRIANLLPGVWSARMPLKLANRRCETALLTRAEPMAAIGSLYGLADERASLRTAWRALLKNQAHDSIGGCSIDRVHRQMEPRYFAAQSLAEETAKRVMERLAGQGATRQTPMTTPIEVAVFNPSPYPRSGVAQLALDAMPSLASAADGVTYHPVLAANKSRTGYRAEGNTVRHVAGDSDGRFFFDEHQHALDLEIPVVDVPAFGYKRVVLQPAEYIPEQEDQGHSIGNDSMQLEMASDGTITFFHEGHSWSGLMALEVHGDRGDSYDADLLPVDERCQMLRLKHKRIRHDNGTQILESEALYRMPRELEPDRRTRGSEETGVRLFVQYIIYPHSKALKIRVRLKNTAKDHRLRLRFPTAKATTKYHYATTLDTAVDTIDAPDASQWLHPAPETFVHQGWVEANGLTVVAPGLPEAQVTAEGDIALTLLRSVGWLSRHDLDSRPGPAGPVIPADEAQCLEMISAELSLFAGLDAIKAQQCEQSLQAVIAGPEPLMPAEHSAMELRSDKLVLSAFKLDEGGAGIIVRLLNPGDKLEAGELICGFPVLGADVVSVDEQRTIDSIKVLNSTRISIELAPHEFRTIRLTVENVH